MRRFLPLLALVGFGLLAAASAVELPASLDPAVEAELLYADRLTDLGLPDYAEIVLDRVQDPAARLRLEVIRLRGLLARGRFEEAESIIAAKPRGDSQEVWALRLALADAYYSWGRYDKARGIYEALFKAYTDGPPGQLNDFYIDSAYRYSQMLLLLGDRKAALGAYRNLQKARLKRHVRRQILSEMADLLVTLAEPARGDARKAYFDEIGTLLDEILWVQDVWFGKAIVMMAHVRLMKGDIEGAQTLLDDYRDQLESIDRDLAKQGEESGEDLAKLSPMAECRYLLAVMMQEEAARRLETGDRDAALELLAGKELKDEKRTTGALQHFLNVFIRYPYTSWAPDAGTRARQVEDILQRDFGARISSNVSDEQMEKVRQAQFQEARALFNQRRFQEAAENYVSVLNLFAEGDSAISALSELARCYIEAGDDLYADMVVRHLTERFRASDVASSKAGDEVLRIAEFYRERNRPDRMEAVYDLYFSRFPEHPRAAATLYRFGEQHLRDEDIPGAIGFYLSVTERYPGSPLYSEALNKMAFCHHQTENTVEEIKSLGRYIQALEKRNFPGHELINGKYRLASAYRQLGGKYIGSAFNRYGELLTLLEGDRTRYQKTAEEVKTNEDIYQGALFYKAICFARLTEPEEKVRAFKTEAVKTFEDLVARFPASQFAPVALGQVGTLWTVLEEPDKARRVLQRLQEQYPDAKEARNALFMLGNNLLQLGMKRQATRIFREMFSDADGHSDAQILTVGNEMLKAREHDIAQEAFDLILARSKQRAHREPAMLGKGKVLIHKERYEEGAAVLEEMLSQYPNSGYTVEACFSLSRAYGTLAVREKDADLRFDLFNRGVAAMKRVRKFEDTTDGKARSDIEVARISRRKAQAEEEFGDRQTAEQYRRDAIAAYQTLILLANPGDPELRPIIESAYHECLPLMLEIERWEDVVEDSDRYLLEFPMGRYAVDVRNARNQARIRLAGAGSPRIEE